LITTTLEEIVADDVAGDPMSNQKWVRRSLTYLVQQLAKRRFRVGRTTVRRLLRKLEYGLCCNRKSLTGPSHPDRDRQFRYIARLKRLFLAAGLPVISVDTKKKELIGDFLNPGRTWTQEPEKVNIHDFRQDAIGRAVPYGIYDLTHNEGYVYVGTSYDTSEFAAYAIAQWWANADRPRFQREDKLLILADAGGSNNCRYWLWKQQIQEQLADQFGIDVMVCHYPTGASKWNPIESCLFSQISRNWAGKPLRSFAAMLNYIRGTVTETGLTVKAFLVKRTFEKGQKVSDEQRAALSLQRRHICPNWNYVIKPRLCSG
jgi:hypothetical protein